MRVLLLSLLIFPSMSFAVTDIWIESLFRIFECRRHLNSQDDSVQICRYQKSFLYLKPILGRTQITLSVPMEREDIEIFKYTPMIMANHPDLLRFVIFFNHQMEIHPELFSSLKIIKDSHDNDLAMLHVFFSKQASVLDVKRIVLQFDHQMCQDARLSHQVLN